jgi:hypothetical protein
MLDTERMPSIYDILRQRGDLSTFIVHLTKGKADEPFCNLVSILTGQRIDARSYFGLPQSRALAEKFEGTSFAQSQKAVCFTETPLAHVHLMCGDIKHRAVGLREYGIAFTRTYARRKGANPIWYLDATRARHGEKRHEWLANPFRDLIDEAIHAATPMGENLPSPIRLGARPIFRLTPFLEVMGQTMTGKRKEFWWEREWRKVGCLDFEAEAVISAIAPEADHVKLRAELSAIEKYSNLRLIDATWDKCKIDGVLEGVDSDPFPT